MTESSRTPADELPEADARVDATGLVCPEPLMLVRNRVRELKSGQVVYVLATDPSTTRDFRDFCRFMGHQLLGERAADGALEFWIRKG
jgi:tRNA 2-thiouridine synthesizing protein A